MINMTKDNIPFEGNLYIKIQWVKEQLLKANLKKTGENKFAGYKYYELTDFLPTIIELCNKVGLFTAPSFDRENAHLLIVNTTKPEEQMIYNSPMEELELKGCNKVQALGGTETYQRRYLYMSAFDITENDMFNGTSGQDGETTFKSATESQLNLIKNLFGDKVKELNEILNGLNKKQITELSIQEASDIISKAKGN